MKYILRIIAVPFVFMLFFIYCTYFSFLKSWRFLQYGGEFIDYKKDEVKRIVDVYDLIKNKKEEK